MRQVYIESVFVCLLFAIYTVMWAAKRRLQRKRTGADPEVFAQSSSRLQLYMIRVFNVVRIYTLLMIVLHTLEIRFFGFFSRFDPLAALPWKVAGFGIGLAGLAVCLIAQTEMKSSWRVGIDETKDTELVTSGVFQYVRNPTYLGLFILNAGVWLIWPTIAMFIMNFLFIYTLDIQVRCEEDFLQAKFGEKYTDYLKHSKRYLPFIY